MTVQRFLALQDLPTLQRPSIRSAVITVDEWGLLSNRMGHELLVIARDKKAEVRFRGSKFLTTRKVPFRAIQILIHWPPSGKE
jgi:hypothetical protein